MLYFLIFAAPSPLCQPHTVGSFSARIVSFLSINKFLKKWLVQRFLIVVAEWPVVRNTLLIKRYKVTKLQWALSPWLVSCWWQGSSHRWWTHTPQHDIRCPVSARYCLVQLLIWAQQDGLPWIFNGGDGHTRTGNAPAIYSGPFPTMTSASDQGSKFYPSHRKQ